MFGNQQNFISTLISAARRAFPQSGQCSVSWELNPSGHFVLSVHDTDGTLLFTCLLASHLVSVLLSNLS